MKSFAIVLVVTTSFITAKNATATPINVTAARYIQMGDVDVTVLGPASPSAALGGFTDSWTANLGDAEVTATQNSNILATGQFGGTGLVEVGCCPLEDEGVFATTFFDVFFDITAPHSYVLEGLLTTQGGLDVARQVARFDLVGPTMVQELALGGGTNLMDYSGTLAPGSYHLTVSAFVDRGFLDPGSFMSNGAASFVFGFVIDEIPTPTPEPGSLALLALGLVIAGLRRRA